MSIHIRRRRVLVAALLGATVAALAITVESHATVRSGDEGRIAVSHLTFRRECCQITTDVLTMAPDGTDVRVVTHSPPGGFSSDPAWAPHGNHILFDAGATEDSPPHLFEVNGNGHGLDQLTSGDGFECCPTMSTNGLIAFDGFFPASATDGAQGIYLTTARGGTPANFRRITFAPPGGFDTGPDFSPDGRKLVFLRVLSDRGPAAAFVVGVDGRGLRQITAYDLDAAYPRWSPDGTKVVFSSHEDSASDTVSKDIWVVNADGTGLTQLTHNEPENHSFEPDWSPDGSRIVFAHFLPTGFFTQLRVMNADGSDEHVIWQGDDFTLDVRPDWGRTEGGDD
jgi:Tol biopolymer transport system component